MPHFTRLLLVAAFLLSNLSLAWAQSLPPGAFANYEYDAVSTSAGAGAEQYQAVRTDAAGNSYVLTLIQGQAKFGGLTITPNTSGFQYGLLKLNSSGGAIWYRKIKNLAANQLDVYDAALHTDAAGNSWLAVSHQNVDTIGAVPFSLLGGRQPVTITKYDANGTQLWANWVAAANTPNVTTRAIQIGRKHPLTVLANGQIVLGGTMIRNGFNYFNGGATVTSIGQRGFLLKLNANGGFVANMLSRNTPNQHRVLAVASSGNRLFMAGIKGGDTLLFPGSGSSLVGEILNEQGNPLFGASVDAATMRVQTLSTKREFVYYDNLCFFTDADVVARSDSGAYFWGMLEGAAAVRDATLGDFHDTFWNEYRIYGMYGAPTLPYNGAIVRQPARRVLEDTDFGTNVNTGVNVVFATTGMALQADNSLLLLSKTWVSSDTAISFPVNAGLDRVVSGIWSGVTKMNALGQYAGTFRSAAASSIAALPVLDDFVQVGTYTGSACCLDPFTITAPPGSAGTNGFWAKYGVEIVVAPTCMQPISGQGELTRCGEGPVLAFFSTRPAGGILEWYRASSGMTGAPLDTGMTFLIANLTGPDTVLVRLRCSANSVSEFTRIPAFIIQNRFNYHLEPNIASPGDTVRIIGTNLQSVDHVSLQTHAGQRNLAFYNVTDESIQIVVPADAPFEKVAIAISDSAGQSCLEYDSLTIVPAGPVGCDITLSSSSGVAGQEIGITGADLSGVHTLMLASLPLSFRRASSTQIFFTLPADSAPGNLVAISGIDDTECRASVFFTVNPAILIPMTGSARSLCGVLYMDPQGTSNYNNNQYVTQTLSPGTPGAKLQLDLSTVQLSDNDQLYVYDGASPASPLLFRSVGGSTAPGKLTATNGAGQLTVRFYSNGAGNAQGFAGALTCLTGASLTPQITSIKPNRGVNGQKVLLTGTNLTGTSVVRFNGRPASFTVKSSLQVEATVPVNVTNGFITLETPNGSAPSPEMFTVIDSLKHFSGTSLLCSGTYTDPQGANANYLPSLYLTQTISASQPTFQVGLDFNQFEIAAGDFMYIYNGASAASPLLVNYRGGITTVTPDTVRSTNGSLTVRFYSDGSTQGAGWLANIFCTGGPVPSPSPARLGEGITETFAFWPNPAKDKLMVRLENVSADALILYNAQGQQAFRASLKQGVTELALPRLAAGLYTVKVGRHTARLAVE